MRDKVIKVDENDTMMWIHLTDVPNVSKPVAVIQAILNFILPGIGTMVAACADTKARTISKT